MKTSKNVVVNRFGRLLSGILSAAMVFSAAAFQTPVSASDENGGYEVLYDFNTDYTAPDTPVGADNKPQITKSGNSIDVTVNNNLGAPKITAILSDEVSEKTVGKKVRWHYDFMWDAGTSAKIAFRNIAYEGTSEKNFLRVGLMHFKKTEGEESNQVQTGYLAYGSGQLNDYKYYEANRVTNPSEFLGSQWYSVDTVYDLGNYKVSYYIDSEKVGETSLNGFSKIKMLNIIPFTWLDTEYYGFTSMHFKNIKLDTGLAANVSDTDDEGAVVKFTMPTELVASDVKVKCLETGVEPSVTVEKINDFTYKVKYPMGTNIGGDYLLSFSDAFAAINGLSDKDILYSQNPSPSYNYYINDDFESYVTTDETTGGHLWFDVKNPDIDRFKNASASNPTQYRVPNRGFYTVDNGGNKMMKINLSQVYDQKDSCSIGFTHGTPTGFKSKNYVEEFDIKNEVTMDEGVTGENDFSFSAYCDRWSMWYPIFSLKNNVLTPYISLNAQTPVTLDEPVSSDGFYHVKVEFRFAGDKKFVIYVDNKEVYSTSIISDLINYDTSMFKFDMKSSTISIQDKMGTAYTLIDNLKTHDGTEYVSGIKSVQYSNDGENYSPAIDKVDAETKYVKIDFASAMDASTLDNIKLSNGSAAVAATGEASSDNKTYTLTLNENLATSTEYTLNIPQTVMTSDGAALAREYKGKIMTTAGVFRASLDIQKNGASVQKSNIVKGDTVNAVVNITNTEGRVGTAYVCVCVYNNNVMTQVNFLPIDLATESTKSVPLNINSVDGLKIKAFLWNSFEKMQPIVPNETVE